MLRAIFDNLVKILGKRVKLKECEKYAWESVPMMTQKSTMAKGEEWFATKGPSICMYLYICAVSNCISMFISNF